MENKDYKIITKYKFWGLENDYKLSDFEKGGYMLLVILFSPIWIWFYLLYLIISAVGNMGGKQKEVKYKRKIEEDCRERYY